MNQDLQPIPIPRSVSAEKKYIGFLDNLYTPLTIGSLEGADAKLTTLITYGMHPNE